jgi:hypothetical protein
MWKPKKKISISNKNKIVKSVGMWKSLVKITSNVMFDEGRWRAKIIFRLFIIQPLKNMGVTILLKWASGLSRLWSYGSWMYNYLSNKCLSPLALWVRILLRRGVLDTTLCDKVCQ